MSCVISVNVLQALGERERKLKIELPRFASSCGQIPGSNGELEGRGRHQLSRGRRLADMYVSQGCGHNGDSPVEKPGLADTESNDWLSLQGKESGVRFSGCSRQTDGEK